MERKESAPQRPRTRSWERSEGPKQPRGVRAQSSPGAQAPETTAFLPQQSKASGPPEPPQPPASRLERLRKEAVPAPPRAAPTSWRKNSFPKPGLGTSVLLYSVLCWYVSVPTLRNRVIPPKTPINICFALKYPDRRKV